MQQVVVVHELDGGPPILWQSPGQPAPAPFAVWWTKGGEGLRVALFGSTSHPARPVGWKLLAAQTLQIEVERPAAAIMSLDMRVVTTVIEPPKGLDPTRVATVILDGQSVTLQPVTLATEGTQ